MNKPKKSIAIKFYRYERWFYEHKMEIIAKVIYHFMQIILGCTIPYTAILENGVDIAHFHGIVIHHKSKIGKGTVIYQNVCIGGRNGRGGAVIGKNCVLGAGSCILGEIQIGDHVNVGANAVVLKDTPSNCTVVGIPAKIVKEEKNN